MMDGHFGRLRANDRGQHYARCPYAGVALAPLAVAPEYQGGGIGVAIVTELDMRATDLRRDFVSVVGDRQFFGRLGFQKAVSTNSIRLSQSSLKTI